ncbi:MAG: endonuclease Q family protein, partial [Planctomycetota bacterium]|nr:endonuclease Q family protein [Planctomycetota bacterium]
MRYIVDLHSHSGYAGGVGNISLAGVAATMARKGIDAFAVGDCLQPAWREKLGRILEEREPGLYALAGAEGTPGQARFVMQTEVIFTSAVASGGRKGTHTVLLFPNFRAVDAGIA